MQRICTSTSLRNSLRTLHCSCHAFSNRLSRLPPANFHTTLHASSDIRLGAPTLVRSSRHEQQPRIHNGPVGTSAHVHNPLRDPATGEFFPLHLIVPVSCRCVYSSLTLFASLRMTATRLLSHPASDLTLRGPALLPLSTRPVRVVAAPTAASGSTRAWRSSRQYTTARATRSTARACCSSAWWTRSGTARRAGRAFMSTRKSNKRAALVVIGRAGRDARMVQFKTSSAALLARCRLTIVSECPRGRRVRLRTRSVSVRNAAVVRLAVSG